VVLSDEIPVNQGVVLHLEAGDDDEVLRGIRDVVGEDPLRDDGRGGGAGD
jgi:hypothetical protein